MTPRMWRVFANPDLLIYLDVSLEVAAQREQLSQPSSWWVEEREVRLADARAHYDLYLDTTDLTPAEVTDQAIRFLRSVIGA
ncbi:MAG: hypothetical protein JXC32_09800 [Anaerolineae bacterium]|nr:hypothetical protein [Anaerolineae bacterium]